MATRKHYRKEPRYVSKLCVFVSSAHGLIEMMRYDSCYPESETESYKIGRLIDGSGSPADHIIRLTRVARTELPPTIERWRSFAAFVLDCRHPDDEPLSDDALASLVRLNHEISRKPR